MHNLILDANHVGKVYYDSNNTVEVLKSVNLQVKPGERIAIIGPSGSGKSTLLHLLGGLDVPSSGKVCLQGESWQALSEKRRCQMRNKALGFVYQFHHLLLEFSALENVCMPLLLGKMTIEQAKIQAHDVLTAVGLSHRLDHRPAQLSGGERQRVAIARALVHKPLCVLADEPTGNLDNTTAAKVLDVMLALNYDMRTALIMVTHDHEIARKMDTVYVLREGILERVE